MRVLTQCLWTMAYGSLAAPVGRAWSPSSRSNNDMISRHRMAAPIPGAVTQDGESSHDSRRSFLSKFPAAIAVAGTGGMGACSSPAVAVSMEYPSEGAPAVRAPIELLRPATRIRLFIDQAIEIGTVHQDKPSVEILQEWRDLFQSTLTPAVSSTTIGAGIGYSHNPFMTRSEQVLSQRYLVIDTNTAWEKARIKEREARGAEQGIDYTTPYDRVNTVIQQWGDKSQFKILRQRQKTLEQSSDLRAALNAYTNNLVFGNAMQLNVQGDERKSLIRNNALPNVNAVVVSDLDLRDLYRNQILQNMDDAQAELEYQLSLVAKKSEGNGGADEPEPIDIQEVLTYLRNAQTSCQKWFSFIPESDTNLALQMVLDEQKDSESNRS